jgi:hypothetical protein
MLLLFVTAITALYLEIDNPLVYIAFIVIFNFVVLKLLGSYLLRSILFPYSNFFIERRLNSQINRKFALEFAKLLVALAKIVKILADIEPLGTFKEDREEIKNKLK